ncbi:hypothetical protein ND748_33620, partial [Frankia sp. AiPs1]|nr:hypothetical protein [Frankia sp. AiPs1]
RLAAAGLAVTGLPALRDVDTIADAEAVARLAPASRFAAALRTARIGLPEDGRPFPHEGRCSLRGGGRGAEASPNAPW